MLKIRRGGDNEVIFCFAIRTVPGRIHALGELAFAVELMVATAEKILNRKSGGLASHRRRSLCRSVISADDRPVDCVTSLCHDDRQSKFSLRSPPLPRGSKNFVSSWLCGENSVSGTQPLVNNLYQGMTLDSVTGLYYERYRNYSPSLGTWISQDPLQYINGANTYQFVMGNPVNATDPLGLAGEEDDAAGDPATPPPSGFWDGLYEAFGFQPYFGPPIVDTPPGYEWDYPPTISPQGAPPDQSLWQLQPTDPNNPRTPGINSIGTNGDTLKPQEQVDLAKKAIKDADDKKDPKPETKGPARQSCPISEAKNSFNYPKKIQDQLGPRGWTDQMIDDTISHPLFTLPATNKATGGPATAYFSPYGGYVVADNTTGAVIQGSDTNDPD